MKRGKRKQKIRMKSTPFLKIREERSFCLSITQDTAAKTESSGSFSMKKRQKNAFGLQSQESEQQGNCAQAHVKYLWSTIAVEWQKKTNIKRLKEHI